MGGGSDDFGAHLGEPLGPAWGNPRPRTRPTIFQPCRMKKPKIPSTLWAQVAQPPSRLLVLRVALGARALGGNRAQHRAPLRALHLAPPFGAVLYDATEVQHQHFRAPAEQPAPRLRTSVGQAHVGQVGHLDHLLVDDLEHRLRPELLAAGPHPHA
eukprot:4703553-Pyramimonas_sp.AAC.1